MNATIIIREFLSSLYGYSPGTIKGMEGCLIKDKNCFLSYTQVKGFDLINTSIEDIESYKSLLLQKLSARTVNKYLVSVRALFKYLRVKGYIKFNPALEVKLPIGAPKEFRVLQPEVVEALLSENFGSNLYTTLRDKFLICLCLRCGLHPHEICRLFITDLSGNMLKVSGRKKFKIITLDNFTESVMRDYLRERTRYLYWRRQEDDTHLFCASTVRHDTFLMTPAGISAIIKRAAIFLHSKYGYEIRGITPMILAHTARFFNWIVMDTCSQETSQVSFLDSTLGLAVRHKIKEYVPSYNTTYQNVGYGI